MRDNRMGHVFAPWASNINIFSKTKSEKHCALSGLLFGPAPHEC